MPALKNREKFTPEVILDITLDKLKTQIGNNFTIR